MELLHSSLHIYCESAPHNGKWISSNVLLFTDGRLQVSYQNEKNTYHLSSNYAIQAPMDTVWHRIPPLPFRRSAKETLKFCCKKSSAFWFLADSEEERDQWYTALTSFTNCKPPPYGDYDNWTYSHLDSESDSKPSHPFLPRKSLTSSHRSGFYSIEETQRKSLRSHDHSANVHHSGLYLMQEHRKSARFPDRISPRSSCGFYAPNKKVTDESNGPVVLKSVESDGPICLKTGGEMEEKEGSRHEKGCCTWCCVAFACLCNIFSACLHQCCMNCAVSV